MLIKHQLSNGTWGRVLSLRDTATNEVAPRPKAGSNKTITHTEDVTVTISPTDPEAAQLFAPMTISLGQKTWPRQVPDVDPLWQQWLDAELVTEELLADVPEPDADILARAKVAKIAALNTWWTAQEATGITPQGADFALGITPNDISLLNGAFSLAQTAVGAGVASADGPFTLIDTNGAPHQFTLAELTGTLLSWGQQRGQLSGTYALTKAAINAASTLEELNVVEMPS